MVVPLVEIRALVGECLARLATLKKPTISSRKKHEDPIFRPRQKGYNAVDLMYISSLLPLDSLSPQSRAYSEIPSSAVYAVAARLMEKAHEAQIVVYQSGPVSGPGDSTGSKRPHDDIDEFCTLNRVARAILNELDVTLPNSLIVMSVSLLTDTNDLGFSLYTNLDLGKRIPSANDIAKVGAYLGLTDSPQWWTDYHFQWIDY